MASPNPSKDDIQSVFRKLRAMPTNKTCFDCNAKNPTWASVTYGVFICIDCSAVHRSLGVHLTFVRSTQLDTSWTWLQLRNMQLGGNASASVFFRQHNCETTDAQQKYTSRAAQLYKDKLSNLAANAMKTHGFELHIDVGHEKVEEVKKDVDFFEEHATSFTSLVDRENNENSVLSDPPQLRPTPAVPLAASLSSGVGPSIDFSAPVPSSGERKSIIGQRKGPAKKTGMGAKKGLGAQRVQTNFAELEKQAEISDLRREKPPEEVKVSAEEEEEQVVSMRLAYRDLSLEQEKEQERLKKFDPKKAQQAERLGMGFTAKTGFSHSAMSDMQTIEQEVPKSSASRSKSTFDSDPDSFFDDYSFPSNFNMFRTTELGDPYEIEKEKPAELPSSKSWYDGMSQQQEKKQQPPSRNAPSVSPDYTAQNKFGNAKAISSAQYFGDSQDDDTAGTQKANLSRFEGSSSISSSDYFGGGSGRSGASGRAGYTSGIASSISAPDLDDVKESVRQGVTKVAGRISSLANGVMNSIQDRYGY